MIKLKKRKILLLPGDGIGPEVIGEVKKIKTGLMMVPQTLKLMKI